jgi:hypothetical protein
MSRVGLAQLIRFLVVKLTHSRSNPKFDMFMHVFIGVSARTCINIYVYTMFLKKILSLNCKTI